MNECAYTINSSLTLSDVEDAIFSLIFLKHEVRYPMAPSTSAAEQLRREQMNSLMLAAERRRSSVSCPIYLRLESASLLRKVNWKTNSSALLTVRECMLLLLPEVRSLEPDLFEPEVGSDWLLDTAIGDSWRLTISHSSSLVFATFLGGDRVEGPDTPKTVVEVVAAVAVWIFSWLTSSEAFSASVLAFRVSVANRMRRTYNMKFVHRGSSR